MADTCSLYNKTRELLVLNLPHGIVPECAVQGLTGTRDYDPTSGARDVVAHRRPLSGSITLTAKGHPGDRAENLPRSVLFAPEVQAAYAAQRIGVVEVSAPEVAPAPASPEVAPASVPPAPASYVAVKE